MEENTGTGDLLAEVRHQLSVAGRDASLLCGKGKRGKKPLLMMGT